MSIRSESLAVAAATAIAIMACGGLRPAHSATPEPRTVKELATLCYEGAGVNSDCGRYVIRIARKNGICVTNDNALGVVTQGAILARGRALDTPDDLAEPTLGGWYVLMEMLYGKHQPCSGA